VAGHGSEGLPWPFFVVMISWLALLFATFGLQAPPNKTVLTVILVSALSVAGAIFVISDMANPYAGIIRVSLEPLQIAMDRLGQA
jgi:spore maturation protein SpmB